ncbi:MAG: transporter, ATP-binding/permease protein [Herbinix sp.]|jgi:ATP-binding cassette subfamily B protein|nr:transporter, ATP-binding/permease protein [Herbinix sp.]
MFKILKFLKKSVFALIIVALLLIIQAQCDLALPTYTSDIVNTGIMQGGINTTIPEVIRQSEMDRLFLFMNHEEKDTVLSHYTLLDKDNFSEKKWNGYLKKYPELTNEALYLWDNNGEEILTSTMSAPMLLVFGIESGSSAEFEAMKQAVIAGMPAGTVTGDPDLITLLSMLPEEAKAQMVAPMLTEVKKSTGTFTTQASAAFIKSEYISIGVDVDKKQTDYIITAGLKMLAVALLGTFASVLVTLFAARIAAKMSRDLRNNVFQKVLSFSNAEMDQFSTASLITRSTNDIQQVQMLMVMMIRIVIYSPILAVGGILKVLNTNSSMTWTLGAGVGAIFMLILTLLVVAMPKFKMMQKLVDRINLVMREILTGLPVIRAFSTDKHEKERFNKANVDVTKNSLFVSRVMALSFPLLMLIMNLVVILIMWVGADKIDAGNMQIGDLFAFISYTMQIIMSFLMLTMVSIVLPRAAVAAKRIDEVLSVSPSIHDPVKEDTLQVKSKGVVAFNNVNFRYPNAEEDVLSDISFTAMPGETTAIIGSTGSGKTTLINLIPRFYDVTQGSITIDGINIQSIKQNTLRKKLGFVPQKGVLFSGTIESNIKFSDSEANDETMTRAARIAQASEFIDAKPEGYLSPISQGGTNVSGGQKQRLSIARAIAKDPDVYVFDDSFSALDYKTDATLRKTLKEELSDRTIIIVAQRISTIMHAEQILVLDDGRIVGKGTHKELLKNCEVYQQIASSQLSKEELEYE